TTPQFGNVDTYIYITGLFDPTSGAPLVFGAANLPAQATRVPISADFAVRTHTSLGAKPQLLDSGAVIDASYFIDRVLGPGGTGGSLNVAIANAALYAVGWNWGLPEVENGTEGPFTSFFDPNVQLINQANVMQEGGLLEGKTINGFTIETPISDANS